MNRIVHFGPGNFFRAHLADYTSGIPDWRITAVSLRSSTIRDGLAGHGNAYTLAVQGQNPKRISVLDDVLVAAENPTAVLDLITNPMTKIMSATVTEKGYHLNAKGNLDLSDSNIQRDLLSVSPTTLIGYIAHALAVREDPITVLSCDNRLGNGDALGNAVRAFADAKGLSFSCEVSFPNSMVDRITPATTDVLRKEYADPMVVPCEPFKEWVTDAQVSSSVSGTRARPHIST